MSQTEINGVFGINMSWVEFFSKINKHPGTFLPDSRVGESYSYGGGLKIYWGDLNIPGGSIIFEESASRCDVNYVYLVRSFKL